MRSLLGFTSKRKQIRLGGCLRRALLGVRQSQNKPLWVLFVFRKLLQKACGQRPPSSSAVGRLRRPKAEASTNKLINLLRLVKIKLAVALLSRAMASEGGERGIRTPGTLLRHTRFPGVPVKPLLHLSLYQVIITEIWRRKLQNIFNLFSYEISPASGLSRHLITSFLVGHLPSKCISLVTEASEVISFPLTTPTSSS